MLNYATFDLETTGFSPARDAITELGWVIVRDGIPETPRSLLVSPTIPVPPDVEQLTGISTALLEAEGVPLSDALREFFAASSGLPLVGHNVIRFDAPFLAAACGVAGFLPPGKSAYRDTAALYKARFLRPAPLWPDGDHWRVASWVLAQKLPGVKYGLLHCLTTFGLLRTQPDGGIELADAERPPNWTTVQQHRAAGDALLTFRLYEALQALAQAAVPTR